MAAAQRTYSLIAWQCLDSMASGACVHRLNRMVAEKEIVLNHLFPPPGLSAEEADRKYQREITELKNIITELGNSIEGLNSRLDEAQKRISKLNDRVVEFIHSEQQKEKKNEERLKRV